MVQSDSTLPDSTTSLFFPIAHPIPGVRIRIERVLGRLHLHVREIQSGDHEFFVALFRLSDFSIMGGAVFESNGPGGNVPPVVFADRETQYRGPDYFYLDGADAMLAVLTAFGNRGKAVKLGAFIALVYSVEDPQFMRVVQVPTGNFLLGVKDDGTIWKSTDPMASPLVWVRVYP